MKVVGSAALLTSLLVAPASSLSYLENLNRANPVVSSPAGGSVANGASYLDALAATASSSPSGGGMTSYLDSLPKNAVPSTAGAGMASYSDSLGFGVGSMSPVKTPPAPAAATPVPAAPTPSTPISSGNYMDSLSGAGSAGAPRGGGMTSYLDTLPRGSVAAGGAGIPTYKDALPVTNTVAGSGAGMSTYTDNLEADDLTSLVEQLRKSGGTIKLSGSIDSISIK